MMLRSIRRRLEGDDHLVGSGTAISPTSLQGHRNQPAPYSP